MPQNAIVSHVEHVVLHRTFLSDYPSAVSRLPTPDSRLSYCPVHSLFEISDVKMFVERDSILFSCCFHVVFSVFFLFFFFSARRVSGIVWSVHYGRVGSGGRAGSAFSAHVRAKQSNVACRFAAKTAPTGKVVQRVAARRTHYLVRLGELSFAATAVGTAAPNQTRTLN